MHRVLTFAAGEMIRRVAKLRVDRFNFDNPSFRQYEEWGWVSHLCLNNAIMDERRNRGQDPVPEYGMLYETLYPHPAHYRENKIPPFHWLIVKKDESGSVEFGDIAFCPFPTVRDHRVCRTPLAVGESLYYPAAWAEAVLAFADEGFVGLNVAKRNNPPPKELDFEYFGLMWNGEKVSLGQVAGLRFCHDYK